MTRLGRALITGGAGVGLVRRACESRAQSTVEPAQGLAASRARPVVRAHAPPDGTAAAPGGTLVSRSYRGKYTIAARLLGGRRGTLLDVGARDRRLEHYLRGSALAYRSADRDDGHDHRVDLERRLPFGDGAFDVVVALDCLEHVDDIHAALRELIRVSRCTTVVALPNLAVWHQRISFLVRGRLATDKYDLTPAAPPDRHRWLTVLPQTDACVRANVPDQTHRLVRVVHETAGGRVARVLAWLALQAGLPLSRALVTRSIYLIEAARR